MDNLKKTGNDRLNEKLLNTPLSEYASKRILYTKNEISKIQTKIRNTKDKKERVKLEVMLDYLKKKLEIESNYKEKVADENQSINDLTKKINKPKIKKFDFQKYFYGESGEKLTKSRVIVTNILYFILVLAAYGIWADFVPNRNIISYGKFMSYILSAVVSILYFWAVFTGRIKLKNIQNKYLQNKFTRVLLVITVFPLFVFGMSWLTFSHGIPALYTRIMGDDMVLITNMEKYKSSSSRSCNYRLEGEVMRGSVTDYLCISKEYYLEEPKKVSVKLTGKESYFGKYIISIYDNMDNKTLQQTAKSGV